MAIYKQTYRGYQGALTARGSRFLVLYRYARRAIFHSKPLLTFFIACYLWPVLALTFEYAMHNAAFLTALNVRLGVSIGNVFFFDFLRYQCFFVFIFAAVAAPGLISPDTANGGLALYLARPFSRWEYLGGKFAALFMLLSELTWMPGLVLFGVQCELGGAAWRSQNLWLGWGLLEASLVWIVVLSLLALALSAWVRWRLVAGAVLLGIYFFGAGLGQMINFVLQTQYGSLLDFAELHLIVWNTFFRMPPPPLALQNEAWAVLVGIVLLSLWLLLRRIRPLEVVK